ncbi:hypothetical protein [Streptococcus sp. HMSC072G04]|jgi:hypothetical protein|uniref:hypothetical protein n=1 Tax=Streptococcus sp. HMSC072G04 TaxID=1739408 RepID=UPI0008A55191|nr:hypothetical protein [Streptococcus sp. HMSC072G04]OFR12906.1 hypothetical protein HMPREF2904_03795 [Streptococcus sp. HMSC072G04]
MNKNVFRRSLGVWLLAIGLLVYSYFQAIPGLHSLEPPQKLYQQGLVYKSKDSEDVLAVKVLDIDLIPVKADEAQYFLIKHEYGVTAMKATYHTVYSLLQMKARVPNQENPLESSGFYLSVKVIPEVEKRWKKRDLVHISQSLKQRLEEKFQQSDLSKGNSTIDLTHLLKSMQEESRVSLFARPVFIAVVAFIFALKAISLMFQLRRKFRRFDSLFPSYATNTAQLIKDADYSDNKLELLVHQGILVFYGMDFEILPVDDIEEIKLFRVHRKSFYRYKMKIIFYSSRRPYVFEINKSNMEAYYPFIDYLRSLAPIIVEDGWKMNYR